MCQTKDELSQAKYAAEIAKQFEQYSSTVMKNARVNNFCWQDILIFVLSLIALFFLIVVTLVCLVQDCLKGCVSCGSILAVISLVLLLVLGVICPMYRCCKGLCCCDATKIAEAHYRFATTYIVEMTRLYDEEKCRMSEREEKCGMENSGTVNIEVNTK